MTTTLTDRRRSQRENTVESLDRDIMLMREMLTIHKAHVARSEVDEFMNRQGINHLITRIPELVAMREGLRKDK